MPRAQDTGQGPGLARQVNSHPRGLPRREPGMARRSSSRAPVLGSPSSSPGRGKAAQSSGLHPQLGKKMNKILQNRQGIHLRGARKCQREPGSTRQYQAAPGSTRQCQAAPGSTRQCQAAPGGAGALIQLTTDNPTTPPLAAPRPCHGQEGEL